MNLVSKLYLFENNFILNLKQTKKKLVLRMEKNRQNIFF